MWELYSRLPREQYVIAAGQCPGSDEFDRTHNLSVVRVPLQLKSWGAFGWRRGGAYYRVYNRLTQLVREQRIESVHANNCLPDGFLAWLLHRRFGLPYLVFVHGEELSIARKSRELRWMTRRVFRGAKLAIANSRNTAQLLCDDWPITMGRIRIVHPGVDTQEFRPAPRDAEARCNLGWNDRRVVLTVGRLDKRKGHEQIIRALPQITKAIPNVMYAIVGAGEERTRLEQLVADLALKGCVNFHGEVSRDELVTAYQQCDVFALPNRDVDGETEGFGMVLLEAQACGKPVVTSDSGGTTEAVNAPESGRIFRHDRPDQIAPILIDLLSNEQLRDSMGQAGRKWVAANFAWEMLAAAPFDLLSACTKSGESKRIPDMAIADSR